MTEAAAAVTLADPSLNSAPEKLIGAVVGKLTLLRVDLKIPPVGRSGRDTLYGGLCSCGRSHFVKLSRLRRGAVSCGMCRSRTCVEHSHLRGVPRTHEKAFTAMWDRCSKVNHPKYKWYGGRGISVDPKWKCYHCFASDMGAKPAGYSLDRIDTTRGYGPRNCRWASAKEQNRNHGRNRWLLMDGERLLLVDVLSRIPSSDSRNLMSSLKRSRALGKPFTIYKGHQISFST